MNFTDADAQRLISIIDQRIEERLRNERPRFGVVAAVDESVGLCSAYLSGETVNASPYIRYPNYLRPQVGDVAMVVVTPSGDRRLIDIFRAAGTSTSSYIDGNLNVHRIRLLSTDDASPTSTAHPFQIGPSSGTNMLIDQNEIMTRNNNSVTTMFVNPEGGKVRFGGAGSSGSGGGLEIGPGIRAVYDNGTGLTIGSALSVGGDLDLQSNADLKLGDTGEVQFGATNDAQLGWEDANTRVKLTGSLHATGSVTMDASMTVDVDGEPIQISQNGYMEFTERSAGTPATPAAGNARLYLDNSGGITRLRIRFDDASTVTIAASSA